MALKKYKPNTAGFRTRLVINSDEITDATPVRHLLRPIKQNAGRNSNGRVTVRFRGGGAKRRYRIVDFKRDLTNTIGTITSIQYDPNRSANIALVVYENGIKRYILAAHQQKIGDKINSGDSVEISKGNHLLLQKIPVGSIIHNVELSQNKGGQIARSAGTYCTLLAKGDTYANVKMPSGEVRQISLLCMATLGQVGNVEERIRCLGKAGAKRWRGRRPHVRGSVMNPCDHPHGGGEGKAPIGHSGPKTPWGKPTLGYKTRNRKKQSNKYIVKRRK